MTGVVIPMGASTKVLMDVHTQSQHPKAWYPVDANSGCYSC